MPEPSRVTGPLLDVLLHLLRADREGVDVHGWAIMHETKRSGPTVYGVLDRLEDCGWLVSYWEQQNPKQGKPRRRLYQLTPAGRAGAQDILADRRPGALAKQTQDTARPGMRRLAPGSRVCPTRC